MDLVMQGVSLVGAALILGAYLGLQLDRWSSDASGYLWANLLGALLLAVVALWDRRIGFVLLEAAWAGVSVRSLLRRWTG